MRPRLDRRTLIFGVLAVVIVLAMWAGGFTYFIHSPDWSTVERAIARDPFITARVGEVEQVSPQLVGFSWWFSGEWAKTGMRVSVKGKKGAGVFRVELEGVAGNWRVTGLEAL